MLSFSRRSAFVITYVLTGSPRPTLSLWLRTPRERKCHSLDVCHRSWGDLAHVSELRIGAGSRKLSFPHCCCREHRHNVGNVFLIEKGLIDKERHGEPCWADEKLLPTVFLGRLCKSSQPTVCLYVAHELRLGFTHLSS